MIFPERIIPSSDTLIMRFHVHSGSSMGISNTSDGYIDYVFPKILFENNNYGFDFSLLPLSIGFVDMDGDGGNDMALRFYDRVLLHRYEPDNSMNDVTGGYVFVPSDSLSFWRY